MQILDLNLMDYVAKFEAIAEAATKEGTLEKSLERMHHDWAEISFTVNPYRDTGTYVIASVDEIQILLDDHLIKTQTMKNSLYIKPFEKETLLVVFFFCFSFFSINNAFIAHSNYNSLLFREWEAKLLLLQNIMDYWLIVQSTWMYLEPIYTSPDIQKQMPEESRRFSAVDKVHNLYCIYSFLYFLRTCTRSIILSVISIISIKSC